MILYFHHAQRWGRWEIKKERRGWACRRGEARGLRWGKWREKSRERKWEEETVTLGLPHLGAYHRLAGGKLLYQPPKGESDFFKHFNKLGERDCPDITTVSVLIRHRALSEPAIPGTRHVFQHPWYCHPARKSTREACLQDLSSYWVSYIIPAWL